VNEAEMRYQKSGLSAFACTGWAKENKMCHVNVLKRLKYALLYDSLPS
jgi:hypothetical protein